MRKILYGGIVIASIILTIIGCRKEKVIDNINQSPTFESSNEKLGNNQKIDLIEMSDIMNNSNNPFNEIGHEFYDSLSALVVNVYENSLDSMQVQYIIENSKWNSIITLNKDELAYYKDYFHNRSYNLETLNDFEHDLLQLQIDKDSKDHLLLSVAIMRWTYYYSYYKGFEDCHDRCMRRKLSAIFDHGNWIEIGAFVANCATETMIIAASCTWNCL